MAGMKELIEDIAKALVDEPEEVAVREARANRSPFWSCGLRRATWGR